MSATQSILDYGEMLDALDEGMSIGYGGQMYSSGDTLPLVLHTGQHAVRLVYQDTINISGDVIVSDVRVEGKDAEGDTLTADPIPIAGKIGGVGLNAGKLKTVRVSNDGTASVSDSEVLAALGADQLVYPAGSSDPAGLRALTRALADALGARNDAPWNGTDLATTLMALARAQVEAEGTVAQLLALIGESNGATDDQPFDPAADPPTPSTHTALLKTIQNVIGDSGGDGQINTLLAQLNAVLGAPNGIYASGNGPLIWEARQSRASLSTLASQVGNLNVNLQTLLDRTVSRGVLLSTSGTILDDPAPTVADQINPGYSGVLVFVTLTNPTDPDDSVTATLVFIDQASGARISILGSGTIIAASNTVMFSVPTPNDTSVFPILPALWGLDLVLHAEDPGDTADILIGYSYLP